MKKMALGVMATGILSIPLVIVSSCSSSTEVKVELEIAPVESPITLNSIEIEGEEYKSLTTLEKLFNNIKQEDIENISVEIDRAKNTITLTANEGYIFSGNLPSISKEFTVNVVEELKITTNENTVFLNTIEIEGEEYKSLTTLEKLFNNIKQEDIENISVEIDRATNTITLTANEGYIFSGNLPNISKEFSLNTELQLSPIESEVTLEATEVEGEEYKSLATLEKLFNNIKQEDIENISVEIDRATNTITLTANEGYIFSGNLASISKEFTFPIFSGTTLLKKDITNLGWDQKTSITLNDWSTFAPNVTKIGDETSSLFAAPFSSNAILESIEIPEKITTIGANAFIGTKSLKTITFENNSKLENIFSLAFMGSSIVSIDLPNSVKNIIDNVFTGTNSLVTISMHISLKNDSMTPKYGFNQTQWDSINWKEE